MKMPVQSNAILCLYFKQYIQYLRRDIRKPAKILFLAALRAHTCVLIRLGGSVRPQYAEH